MKTNTKRNLQTLALWVILMTGILAFHDFSAFGWILGAALACLVVSGLITAILDKYARVRQREPISVEDAKSCDDLEGLTHHQIEEIQKALGSFYRPIACGSEDNVYAVRGDCLQVCGLHAKAVRQYDIAIALRPEDCDLFFRRYVAKSAAGDIDGAIEDLQEAIRLSKVDNELNEKYRLAAKEIGWYDGHTSLFKCHSSIAEAKKRILHHRVGGSD